MQNVGVASGPGNLSCEVGNYEWGPYRLAILL